MLEESAAARTRTLPEAVGKRLLAAGGVPVAAERAAATVADAVDAAEAIGYPVVLKGVAPGVTHKTELKLVELDLRDAGQVRVAATAMLERAPEATTLLIQEMVAGERELLLGLTRDAQFGPCVTFGWGGIFAEALEDVALRVAPFDTGEARAMILETKVSKVLQNFRGMPDANVDAIADALCALSRIGVRHPGALEIDINPMIISGSRPVAVDALVIWDAASDPPASD